ncbi:hypothetical protein COV16_07480 [Candidatus Woesearchaeota archaeon CG10_big_fil_rev_8_21_14_0_10_34_8]|nr:MAG: hypothetical protein COV16_07480 [Candidatus Woesearchaeota archaeon CG10_big_fil_rev_8_21_14_0_10_34_8]
MLKFLKKIFQKDEVEVVLPKQNVKFSELKKWLDDHTSKNAKSIAETVKPVLDKIDDAIVATQNNLKKLEYAELKNKNISGRELSIMKGNRNSYILRTGQFLEKLESLYDKENITYADMKGFSDTYKEDVEVLNKMLLKPYAVLQHFFANESYAVAKQIKTIDVLMKELSGILQKESLESITDCKNQIDLIMDKQEQLKKLQKEKKELDSEAEKTNKLLKQAEQKFAKVEESSSYEKYKAMLKEKEDQSKKIQDHVEVLTHSFAIIDKAIRKFAKKKIQHEKLIEKYVTDPLKTLLDDNSFTIVSVLEEVKSSLDDLGIKDDKKAKTLAELDNVLTDLYFYNFVQKYKELKEREELLDKNARTHFALQQHKEAEYVLTSYKEKSYALNEELRKISEILETVDIDAMIKQLEKDLHKCTKFEVEVVTD